MSKSLSKIRYVFLWVLLVLPMTFMLTACDNSQLGTQAKCDTRGNYTESSIETFNTVATDTATTLGDSYRMTVKMKMDLSALGSAFGAQTSGSDTSVDLTINVIVTKDAMAMKMSGKADGEKRDVTMYIANGKLYAYDAVSKEKAYIEVAANADLETVLAELNMDTMLQSANLETILQNIKTAGNVTVTANGNHFKLEYTASSLPNVVYLNFDNAGKFEAVQAEMDLGFMQMTAIMCTFDGEIELPNFDGYKQADNLDFLDE